MSPARDSRRPLSPATVKVRERAPIGSLSLSVIVPAYNERDRLPATLREVAEYFHTPVEIVVADDGSTDGTAEVAAAVLARTAHAYAVIRHSKNHGKGCAVRLGMLHARGGRFLIIDADSATPIAQWEKLRRGLEAGADIVVGSRAVPEARIPVAQPWYRRPLGPAYNLLVQTVLFGGIRDTQCGFKAYRADVARELFSRQRIDSFTFDPEVIFLALRRGYRVDEVGVVWNDQPDSKVSVLRDPLRMFWDLLRVRLNAMRGAYEY
ncbi:MAG: dolichyl-phosphate beta-glucosyltransferase [Myxococcota bacterium]